MTALIAVAHGSRDPRSAATVAAMVSELRLARPGLDVRLSFLDLNAPSVSQVIDSVAAQGYREAVVVPLLLGNAFHARVDLPAMLALACLRHPELTLIQAEVLGTDARLAAAVRERILDTDVTVDDPSIGIALAGVGSSSTAANERTKAVAAQVCSGTRWRVGSCFVTATEPAVEQAVAELRASGAGRIVVAPWFLAPGLLTDRLFAATPGLAHAATIGAHRGLVEVALDRFDAARAAMHSGGAAARVVA
ncbi:sirohydrochlorin chelatase [Skermania sp. ID1734]|uniref:sirohydrochlorin chelatase n=1 Tax=Skermania sp. ID1734 TaxID=2597516 RepID=UPI00117FB952|nr:sirohydrochlorin chelatase [Skermania sp. ID1734]TSE00044.1 sirohydrochlorin chelatase [Skermania sp. ID1734]